MNIKEAELLFQAGVLETPVIKKDTQGEGWVVTLDGTHQLNPLLETTRGSGPGVFKDLDAAAGVLFGLGFGEPNAKRQEPFELIIGYTKA